MGVQATVNRPLWVVIAVLLLAPPFTGGCQSSGSAEQLNRAAFKVHRQAETTAASDKRDWLSSAVLETLSRDSYQYRVGTGDLLRIEVFALHSPDELSELLVRVDDGGGIKLPLVGQVSVQDLMLGQIESKLNGLYAPRFIKRPNVSARIKEYRTRSVMVAGEVAKPGVYELNRRQTTALHALLLAGGINEKARQHIRIVRVGFDDAAAVGAGDETMPVQRQEFLLDLAQRYGVPLEQTAAGFELQEGDVVLVEQESRRLIYVYGLVKKPGIFEINREERVSVLQAVAMAGGIEDGVTPYNAVLTRFDDAPDTEGTKIDLVKLTKGTQPNLEMGPGDVLNIGHNAGTRVQQFFWHIFKVGGSVPLVP